MIDQLIQKLHSGDRLSLAKAITLVESESEGDQKNADSVLEKIHQKKPTETFRIGLSGVPGVGKSSLIERLGLEFINLGYKVAVLAIDPSSEVSRGSILGDKTRMEELSKKEEAFIRPSPSRGHLGGVAVATKDTIKLCEAAGYDIIIVETVGVGQSEALVADLVDCFLFLSLPGAGDELQGIKKGVLERVDLVVVNKADGSNKIAAELAQKQLKSSLKILRSTDIPVFLTSATTGMGVKDLADYFKKYWSDNAKAVEAKRQSQEFRWLNSYLEQFIKLFIVQNQEDSKDSEKIIEQVKSGQVSARQGARKLFELLLP